MKFIFFISLILTSICLANPPRCESFFSEDLIRSDIISLLQTEVPKVHGFTNPLQTRQIIVGQLRRVISRSLNELPHKNFKIALNLSFKENLHILSEGLSSAEHQQVLQFLKDKNIEMILSSLPNVVRNKYFEIHIFETPEKTRAVEIKTLFAWQISFPLKAQTESGFAQTQDQTVRPFNRSEINKSETVRTNLLQQKRSQETYYTCGLSSLTQILSARNIPVTERELLEMVHEFKIKTSTEFFGKDPGLTINQLYQLALSLGERYQFKVHLYTQDSADNQAVFDYAARVAAQGGRIDVVANYNSPVVGRPGAGHFSPIGGYNSQTKEILLSETNLAANPPFWVSQNDLFAAMMKDSETVRGFLVIEWD